MIAQLLEKSIVEHKIATTAITAIKYNMNVPVFMAYDICTPRQSQTNRQKKRRDLHDLRGRRTMVVSYISLFYITVNFSGFICLYQTAINILVSNINNLFH